MQISSHNNAKAYDTWLYPVVDYLPTISSKPLICTYEKTRNTELRGFVLVYILTARCPAVVKLLGVAPSETKVTRIVASPCIQQDLYCVQILEPHRAWIDDVIEVVEDGRGHLRQEHDLPNMGRAK